MEELGSGCGRDIGGGGWLGGRLEGDRRREGGKGRSVQGRENAGVGLLSRFSTVRRWIAEGGEDVLTPVHLLYLLLVMGSCRWRFALPHLSLLHQT